MAHAVLSPPGVPAQEQAGEAPARPEAQEGGRRRLDLLVLAGLSLALVVVGLVQAAHDAPTVDEGVEITAGVVGVARHDLRLTPEHALVVKLGAAPALLADPIIPDTAAYRSDDWFTYNDQFIRANRAAGKLDRILFLARLVPLVETIGCLWLVHALARRLFGGRAGLLSAGLWATTPLVVGLGHFVTIDIAFTLATLAVSLALLRFLEERTVGRAAVVGLALGWALATRHTALVLLALGVIVIAAAMRQDRRRAAEAAGTALGVAVATLWAAYRLVAPSAPGGVAGAQLRGVIDRAGAGSALARLVTSLPFPLEWRAGFAYLDLTSGDRGASLLGQSWTGTRWWYFPAVLLTKVPVGVLVAIAVGAWCCWRLGGTRRRRAMAVVVAPAGLLFAFTAAQPLELGVRLLLPSIALAMVLAGPVVAGLRHRAGRVALALLAVTQLAVFLLASAHPLTWTALPFTPNYRWVSDSNLDYGQAEFDLERWSRGRHPWVAVANTRGIDPPPGSRDLLRAGHADVQGWVAVGSTPMMVLHPGELSWVRAYCPVGQLGGGAILLYRFERPADIRPGPSRPAARCADGDRFSTRAHR